MQDRFKFRAIVKGCCEMDTPKGCEEFEPLIFLENVDILPKCSQVGILEEDLEWAIREQHPNLTNNDIEFILEYFYNDSCGVGSYIAIIPEVIQQCTGLKDKNGNLIYEGDIVYITSEEEYVKIEWSVDLARFTINFINQKVMADFDNYYSNELEVVGNIYENLELLSEEK